MKNMYLIILVSLAWVQSLKAQQNYCDFEGTKFIHFGMSNGTMDSIFTNYFPNSIDSSDHCARYIRSTALFDNFKLYPEFRLADISSYATHDTTAFKITMKAYCTAPVGTAVEIQLGKKSDDNYPSGIHSEYRATTSKKNEWQNLDFNYVQSTPGSMTNTTEIDKIVVLLNPNSITHDTIYFDDLTGPSIIPFSVPSINTPSPFKLYQCQPNPAKEITHISFELHFPGMVSLTLFDWIGNPVQYIFNKKMNAGFYSIPVETTKIPAGIYYYILSKEGFSKAGKLIVSK